MLTSNSFSFSYNFFSNSSRLSIRAFSLSTKRDMSLSHCFFSLANFSIFALQSFNSLVNVSFSFSISISSVACMSWVDGIFIFFFYSWMVFSFSFSNFWVVAPWYALLSITNKSACNFFICCWWALFSTFSCLSWFSILLLVNYSLDTFNVAFNK